MLKDASRLGEKLEAEGEGGREASNAAAASSAVAVRAAADAPVATSRTGTLNWWMGPRVHELPGHPLGGFITRSVKISRYS